MKIICITGAPGSDVNRLAGMFAAAGVQPALPLRQDPAFSLADWHEKVLAAAQSAGEAVQPGRFWEQLATNLFMENMRHPLWAWADPRSVWLLDFWQQFEPNLHFVLVYSSPQRALAEALADGGQDLDTAGVMAAWAAHQQEILRFHLRNPKRSILVDAAACERAPDALLAACAARWKLELAPVAGQLPAPLPAAPLVGYLAEQLRQAQPGLQELQRELEASLLPLLPQAAPGADAPGLFAALEDYRRLRGAAARAPALDEQLAQALAGRQAEVAALRSELDAAGRELKRLADERASLADKSALEAASREAAGQRADADAARRGAREAQQESELLLVQLHQVQEELEHYFLEHKKLGTQNEELRLRRQRMLERNPAYCDYAALELLSIEKDGTRSAWRFSDLDAAGRAFPELRFDIVVAGGRAAFAFARGAQAPGAPDPLETLGSADWLLLPTLCRVLDEALQHPAGSLAQLGAAQRDALRNALAGLLEHIAGMPAALRFDRVALKREQVNPDYEHLWLQLGNLSLGSRHWSEAEFRLSCANVRPGKFGAHPKLEFPSGAGAVLFDSWFAESCDDFGDKLELRFALPEAMDMSVWQQLSEHDQLMLALLAGALPQMLARLGDEQASLARPLADWQQLAANVQAILAIRTGIRAPAPALAQ